MIITIPILHLCRFFASTRSYSNASRDFSSGQRGTIRLQSAPRPETESAQTNLVEVVFLHHLVEEVFSIKEEDVDDDEASRRADDDVDDQRFRFRIRIRDRRHLVVVVIFRHSIHISWRWRHDGDDDDGDDDKDDNDDDAENGSGTKYGNGAIFEQTDSVVFDVEINQAGKDSFLFFSEDKNGVFRIDGWWRLSRESGDAGKETIKLTK